MVAVFFSVAAFEEDPLVASLGAGPGTPMVSVRHGSSINNAETLFQSGSLDAEHHGNTIVLPILPAVIVHAQTPSMQDNTTPAV